MATWAEIEDSFGAEPSVAWDRDMADCGWAPVLRSRGQFARRETWELWADCPSCIRGGIEWSIEGSRFDDQLRIACRCHRWNGEKWAPRIERDELQGLVERETKALLNGPNRWRHDFTNPGIVGLLKQIAGVIEVDVRSPAAGVVDVVAFADPDVNPTGIAMLGFAALSEIKPAGVLLVGVRVEAVARGR